MTPCDGLPSLPVQLSEILKFGVDKLLSSDESSVQAVELDKILGATRDGQWLEEEVSSSLVEEPEEEDDHSDGDGQSGSEISFCIIALRTSGDTVATFFQTTCTASRGRTTAKTPVPTTRRALSV